jgi:hypothetical protein
MAAFQSTISTACPQLHTRLCNDTHGLDRTFNMNFRHYLHPAHYNDTFRKSMDDELAASPVGGRANVTVDNPLRVLWGDPYIAWNYTAAQDSAIKRALYSSISYNEELLRVGKIVHEELLAASSNTGPIVAIHYRGEKDWPAPFGSKEMQARVHIAELARQQEMLEMEGKGEKVTDVYISCGDRGESAKFQKQLQDLGYKTHDKHSLLASRPEVLAEIDSASFDERAVAEFETLKSADRFLGILSSSLSAFVSYAREGDEFFENLVHRDSWRGVNIERHWGNETQTLRGNGRTGIIVIDGPDISDCFP